MDMEITDDKDFLATEQIFKCTCGDFSHTFKVETMKNGGDEDEFSIDLGLAEEATLWDRIKIAARYIWTGRSCRWDRIMKRADMLALKKQLEAHFAKSNRKVRK